MLPSSQSLDATGEAGERLDRALARAFPEVSRSRFQALIADGRVTVEGVAVTEARHRLKGGEAIRVSLPAPAEAAPRPEALPLAVVYEDSDLIVVDKPADMVVHPAPGHPTGTLVNALIAHCGDSLSGVGGVKRPGIVHRLDKGTSGLIVAAKNDKAHRGLAAQFAAHGRDGRLERAYLAVVWGAFDRPRGTIAESLGRSSANRQKVAVTHGERGREAVTHYEEIARYGNPVAASLLRCCLETGRTHQIRVHMAHRGHPLLGDLAYGSGFKASRSKLSTGAREALKSLNRQALHAAVLGFDHPRTGRHLRFESPPPADLARLLTALGEAITTG